jgi:hypothetical protein
VSGGNGIRDREIPGVDDAHFPEVRFSGRRHFVHRKIKSQRRRTTELACSSKIFLNRAWAAAWKM